MKAARSRWTHISTATRRSERLFAAQLPLDERALKARTDAVRIGTQQSVADRQDLLWVAELQTGQLASQDALVRLRSAQRANRIRLYQALGGGFGPAPELAAVALPRAQ